jgi:DNA-binding transcriptional regulator YdaS (Cro superfamily)
MVADTKTRILQRALEIVGSHEDLARLLQVRQVPLATWLGGVTPVPDDIFLRAVDIVLNDETKDVSLFSDVAVEAAPTKLQ